MGAVSTPNGLPSSRNAARLSDNGWLAKASASASRDAGGVPVALLGDYLTMLADAGFTVWAAARRTDRLAELAAESPAITAVSLDVTSPESVAELARSVNGEPDGLALLVNNAGAPSAWNRSRPRTPPSRGSC